MIPELKDMDYIDCLKALKLSSMYYRRDRGDMIESYKYTHDMYKAPFSIAPERSRRGHNTISLSPRSALILQSEGTSLLKESSTIGTTFQKQ